MEKLLHIDRRGVGKKESSLYGSNHLPLYGSLAK